MMVEIMWLPTCQRSVSPQWLLLLLLLLLLTICHSNNQQDSQKPADQGDTSLTTEVCPNEGRTPELPSAQCGVASGCSPASNVSQDEKQLVKSTNPSDQRQQEATGHPPKEILSKMIQTVDQRDKRNSFITTEVTLTDNDPQDRSRPQNENVTVDLADHMDSNDDNQEEPSFISTVYDTMLLCHHPPKKFSPQFFTHPVDSCAEYGSGRLMNPRTISLCDFIYRKIYGRPAVYHWFYQVNKTNYRLFYDENFNALCLPLFQRFNHCEEKKLVTLCRDEEVLFLHPHSCEQPSALDKYFTNLLIISSVLEDEECYDRVCDGSVRIVESNVSGLTFRLAKLEYPYGNGTSCHHLFDLYKDLRQGDENIYVFANIYFPCCYANYIVLWAGSPENRGLNPSWDFMPLSCRISELLLVMATVFMGVCGTVGNTAILVVMLGGRHTRRGTTILRTSLAFADLFINLFVVIPSVTDHISTIVWGQLNSEEVSWKYHPEPPREIDYYSVFVVESGYYLFQAIVLTACSAVSLFSLFFLSIERYLLACRHLLAYKHFSVPRVTVLVILTWIMAFLDALSFTFDGSSKFNPFWSNMKKFTIGISELKSGGFSSGIFYFRIIFLFISCIATFIFSSLAPVRFVEKEAEVEQEWKSFNMRVSGPIAKENRHILVTMILMAILFPISVIPVGVSLLMQVGAYFFPRWELFSYISWWLFIAASAWNPWLYNMRCRKFQKDMKETFSNMVPTKFKQMLHPCINCFQRKDENRTRESSARQMNMLRSLGLTSD